MGSLEGYVEKKALDKALSMGAAADSDSRRRAWVKAICILHDIQPADVVPVVRCRECKHYKEQRTKKYGNLICRCTRMGKYDMDYPIRPDDFCSYGEKSNK